MPSGVRPDGLKIAKARQALPDRPSQAAFANRIGIHFVTQSNIENGKANVSLELLERIAKELGLPRDALLPEDEAEAASMTAAIAASLAEVLQALVRTEVREALRERVSA